MNLTVFHPMLKLGSLAILSLTVMMSTLWAEPATKEAAADYYKIPEKATSAELIKFANHLENPPTRPKSREEYMAHIEKAMIVVEVVADQVLEDSSADIKDVLAAIKLKQKSFSFQEYISLSSEDDKKGNDLDKKKAAFQAMLKADKRPEVVAIVERMAMQSFLQKWGSHKAKEKTAFIEKFLAKFKKGEPSIQSVQTMTMITRSLNRHGDKANVDKIYSVVLPILKKSENSAIKPMVERIEGTIRRENLVGNEMKLEGTFLDGSKLDWSKYKGKVVLVDFWATWCGPCIGEMPHVKHEYARYHDKGFEVLAISLDESKEPVLKFVEKNELPWKCLIGEGEDAGWNHPMARYYAISGIPTAILIGKDGKVVTLRARGKGLTEALQKLLGDPIEVKEEAAEAEEK